MHDTPIIRKIEKIAKSVQDWSRLYVTDLLKKDNTYDFNPSIMHCMCAYSSTVLFECLTWQGIPDIALHHNEYHAFITKKDILIDITACQFSDKFKEIEIVELTDFLDQEIVKNYCAGYWDKKYTHYCVDSAYTELHCSSPNGFPSSQYFRKKQELFDAINSAKLYLQSTHDKENML